MDRRFNRGNKKPERPKEEFVIVLDVVLDNTSSFKSNEKIQALGYNTYSLLELVTKPGVSVKTGQKLYVGDGKRDEVQYIKRILPYDLLTASASSELSYVVEDIIEEKEEMFVNFFNTAGPISLRRHSLELIPGVGKKNLQIIFDERSKKPFESYKDISERLSFLSDPIKSITQRIMNEIKGETEHRFFSSISLPPKKE